MLSLSNSMTLIKNQHVYNKLYLHRKEAYLTMYQFYWSHYSLNFWRICWYLGCETQNRHYTQIILFIYLLFKDEVIAYTILSVKGRMNEDRVVDEISTDLHGYRMMAIWRKNGIMSWHDCSASLDPTEISANSDHCLCTVAVAIPFRPVYKHKLQPAFNAQMLADDP